MKNLKNIYEIARFIQSFEEECKDQLLNYEYNGWLAWSILRQSIYFYYRNTTIKKPLGSNARSSFSGKIKRTFLFIHAIFKLVILSLTKKNSVLILTHPNNLLDHDINNKKIDVYFQGFLKAIEKNQRIHLSLGSPTKKSNHVHPPDIFIGEMVYIISKSLVKKDEVTKKVACNISTLLNDYAKDCNIPIKVPTSEVENMLATFSALERVYSVLLRLLRPKLIVMQNSVGNPITAATNKFIIPLYEVQHGFFHYNKPDYYFPEFFKPYKNIIPLPNQIVTFGFFFNRTIQHTGFWDKEDTVAVGSFKIEKYRALKDEILHKEAVINQKVMCVLQPSCFTYWKDLLNELANIDTGNMRFILKPHPNDLPENCKWYEHMANTHSTKFIFLPKTSNLMKWMLKSDFVVGFHSTAIFEAAALGKNVIVLKFPDSSSFLTDMTVENIAPFFVYATDGRSLMNILTIENNQNYVSKVQQFGEDLFRTGYHKNIAALLRA